MTDLRTMYPDDVPASAPAPHAGQPDRQADRTDLILYPNDQPDALAQPPRAPVRPDAGEEPPAISYDEAADFDPTGANSFFNQAALAALKEGDHERSAELDQAGKALVDDMKAAGTPAAVFNEALAAFNEADADNFTEDQRAQMAEATMADLRADFGPTLDADLSAARALIADLDKLTPGLIASLEASGAGNNPRLIRTAIEEAKRRGYGRK